jgi:hypothetical protein
MGAAVFAVGDDQEEVVLVSRSAADEPVLQL